jgi:hypothetical protein
MNYSETEHALAVHSRRETTRAIAATETAERLRSDAAAAAAMWSGPGAAVEEKRRAALERGEIEAQKHEQMSQRHLERSAAAAAGYLLHRTDVEARDPAYCMEHQALIAASYKHGLVRTEPMGG